MRRFPASTEPAPAAAGPRNDWQTIRSLLPYLTTYKARVLLALSCLIGAKLANLGVPIVMKRIVDGLTPVLHLQALGRAEHSAPIVLAGGIGLLVVAYALVRLSTSLFTELREILFAKVTESAVRQLALQVFRHLHGLFSPRPADGRHVARHRARHAWHPAADFLASLQFRVGGFFRVKGGRSPAQRTLDAEKSTSPSGGEDFPALGRGLGVGRYLFAT
ncbi:MAG: ATM1-type heavy metal exporter [Burkholderia gladioli]|nr:MAG: ATM1-type heavy metal exporter [Burkholderia gladioli]